MDRKKIEQGVRLILDGIGEDTSRPGLLDTPRRVAGLYAEIFSGIELDPMQHLVPVEGETHEEMVLIREIPLYSVCEHHLLPFAGMAHVA